MKLYRFHWRDGKESEGAGRDVVDAFRRLGYGGGAIRALDYYEVVDSNESDPLDDEHDRLRNGSC